MSKKSEQLRQQNRIVEESLKKQLSEFHSKGMIRGAYAMCKVILEKANDTSKPTEERLADIVKFCKTAVNPDEVMVEQSK